MKRLFQVKPVASTKHRALRSWITVFLVIDGILTLLSFSVTTDPASEALLNNALNGVLGATIALLAADLCLTLFHCRHDPKQFLMNPWNLLDIVTLAVAVVMPAYRSLILMRFGRVLSHLIGVGSRSILKSILLAREVLTNSAIQLHADNQSRIWDLALRGSHDGLWEWNVTAETFKFSQRWRDLHGYGEGQLEDSYQAWLQCIHPGDRSLVLQALHQHLDGEQSFFSMEYRSRLGNGEYGWFIGRGVALRDSDGQPLLMIGSEADISPLRQSEQKLEHREKIIQEIFDNVPLLLAVYDRNGKISLANRLFRETFRIHQDDADDSELQLQLISESLRDYKQQLFQLLQDNSCDWVELEMRVDSGKSLDFAWLSSKLDENSTILLGQDLTYRHRVENALAQEREFAQVTLRSIGDAVITIDLDGRVETLNVVAEKLTGWSQEEAWHQPLNQVVHLLGLTTEERRPPLIQGDLEESQLEVWRGRHLLVSKTGQQSVVNGSVNGICDRHHEWVGIVLVFRDITQSYYLEQELSWQATHDALTGLQNHRALETRLHILNAEESKQNTSHVFAYVDLDQLDLINGLFGYVAGDQFLSHAGRAFKKHFRAADIIARLGGGEFGVLLSHFSLSEAVDLIRQFQQGLKADKFVWQDRAFTLSASIGLVCWDGARDGISNIINVASETCYKAKKSGRNQLEIHNWSRRDMDVYYGKQSWWFRISQALDEDRFCLFAQKIIPLKESQSTKIYEVLIRMVGVDGQLISPGQFMPSAERYNLMPDVDRWVVVNFLKRYWELLAPYSEGCIYTINLSGASLSDDNFCKFLKNVLDYPESPASQICFEVTETIAIANLQKATKFIEEIKSLGCLFALDDFGSGMSSLAYLRTLPVDYLKIDGMFVRDILTNKVDRTMVESCYRIAHSLGIETIAEFVENAEIMERLRGIGVDYAQGFGIAHPQSLETLMDAEDGLDAEPVVTAEPLP